MIPAQAQTAAQGIKTPNEITDVLFCLNIFLCGEEDRFHFDTHFWLQIYLREKIPLL